MCVCVCVCECVCMCVCECVCILGTSSIPDYLYLYNTYHNIGVCAAWSCRVDLDAIVIEKKVYVCASEC